MTAFLLKKICGSLPKSAKKKQEKSSFLTKNQKNNNL